MVSAVLKADASLAARCGTVAAAAKQRTTAVLLSDVPCFKVLVKVNADYRQQALRWPERLRLLADIALTELSITCLEVEPRHLAKTTSLISNDQTTVPTKFNVHQTTRLIPAAACNEFLTGRWPRLSHTGVLCS